MWVAELGWLSSETVRVSQSDKATPVVLVISFMLTVKLMHCYQFYVVKHGET
jgi:hypothetical protein